MERNTDSKKRIRRGLEGDIYTAFQDSVLSGVESLNYLWRHAAPEQCEQILSSDNFVESTRLSISKMASQIRKDSAYYIAPDIDQYIDHDLQQARQYSLKDLYDVLKWLNDHVDPQQFHSILNNPERSQAIIREITSKLNENQGRGYKDLYNILKLFNDHLSKQQFDAILDSPEIKQSISAIIIDDVRGIFPDDLLSQLALQLASKPAEMLSTDSYEGLFKMFLSKAESKDPNIKQKIFELNDYGALKLATQKGYTRVVERLFNLAANLYRIGIATRMPLLILAAKNGHTDTLAILVDAHKISRRISDVELKDVLKDLFIGTLDSDQIDSLKWINDKGGNLLADDEFIARICGSPKNINVLDWLKRKIGNERLQSVIKSEANAVVDAALDSPNPIEILEHVYQDVQIPMEAISSETVKKVLASFMRTNDIRLLIWLKGKIGNERFQSVVKSKANAVINAALDSPNPAEILERVYQDIEISMQEVSSETEKKVLISSIKRNDIRLLTWLKGKVGNQRFQRIIKSEATAVVNAALDSPNPIEILEHVYQDIQIPMEEMISRFGNIMSSAFERAVLTSSVKRNDTRLLTWLKDQIGDQRFQNIIEGEAKAIVDAALKLPNPIEILEHVYQDVPISMGEKGSVFEIAVLILSIKRNDTHLLNWLKSKIGNERFQKIVVESANGLINIALEYPNPINMLEHIYQGIEMPQESISEYILRKILRLAAQESDIPLLNWLKGKIENEHFQKIAVEEADTLITITLDHPNPANMLEHIYQGIKIPQESIPEFTLHMILRSAAKESDIPLLNWLKGKIGDERFQKAVVKGTNTLVTITLEHPNPTNMLEHIYQGIEIPEKRISEYTLTRTLRSAAEKGDIPLLNWLEDKIGSKRFKSLMKKDANAIVERALTSPRPIEILRHLEQAVEIRSRKFEQTVIDRARALDGNNGNTLLSDWLKGKSRWYCRTPGGRRKRAAMSCRLNANEYIERLRELPIEEQIRVTEANAIEFIGSAREVGQAEKARDLLRTETMTVAQKSYEMDELFKNPQEERILDLFEGILQSKNPNLSEDTSQSKNPKYQELMNAAGRILFIQGAHRAVLSCIKQEGSVTISTKDCAFSTGEMVFSFLSQPIENGMLKITPKVVKSAASVAGKAPVLGKNLEFVIKNVGKSSGKMIAKGLAGGITGVFDIVDVAESADTLILCLRKREEGKELCSDKEIRDSVAGITFGSVSFISGVALTALAMPGVGTMVGLTLMVSQGVYSGVSNVREYEEKYDTTPNENLRILLHTAALQPIPQDVQELAAQTEIVNNLAKEAWERLQNSTNVVAIAMGLGDVAFTTEVIGRIITKVYTNSKTSKTIKGRGCISSDSGKGTIYATVCNNVMGKIPHILPGHASINMNETNADTTKFSRVVPESPSADAKMLGLPMWTDREKYEYEEYEDPYEYDDYEGPGINFVPTIKKRPHFSENPEAIYLCDNALVMGHRERIANDDQNATVLFLLENVKDGKVTGSNTWRNVFQVGGGHPQVSGGDNTDNTFDLRNETFSGEVSGGDNSTNILDLSKVNSPGVSYNISDGSVFLYDQQIGKTPNFIARLINWFIGRQGKREDINCDKEIFVNSGGGYNNDEKDLLMNCEKAVISPYTKAIGGNGKYTFYIKPSNILEAVGRSEIDISGNGTLVFLETALLKDCRIIYSKSSNTLSFEIPLGQNKTFVLEVKNYLNKDKTPKFRLIDKHGSNIVPIIRDSDLKEDPAQIKTFRLNEEKEAFEGIEEDEAWYRSISQSDEDYQVVGVIEDKRSKQKRVFGNSGTNIMDVSGEVIFARGGNGSDVYLVKGNSGASTVIDNYAGDRELDVLLIQQNSTMSVSVHKFGRNLRLQCLSPYTGGSVLTELVHRKIEVTNYFQDASYQHLIISTGDGMLIPFISLEGEVRLVPFYHASNSKNVFFLSEDSTEIVIDAKMEDAKFYRNQGDLLLIIDKDGIPLTIIVKDFYFDQSKWQSVNPYFWNQGEFASFDLSKKAEGAVSYEEKIESDYKRFFTDYVYTELSGEIAHNQQVLGNGTLATRTEDEKRKGVLVLDVDPRRVGLVHTANDLTLFDKEVDHKNLTIRGWKTSKDHRISRVEFDLESGRVVINKLDRFGLSVEEVASMQNLLSRASTNSRIDKNLRASDIANNFQCLITMYGSNTYKCLGFLALEDQINFAKAYCNSQKLDEFTDKVQKNNTFALSLIQFIINYNQLKLVV